MVIILVKDCSLCFTFWFSKHICGPPPLWPAPQCSHLAEWEKTHHPCQVPMPFFPSGHGNAYSKPMRTLPGNYSQESVEQSRMRNFYLHIGKFDYESYLGVRKNTTITFSSLKDFIKGNVFIYIGFSPHFSPLSLPTYATCLCTHTHSCTHSRCST